MKRQQILDQLSVTEVSYRKRQELTKALASFTDLSQNPFQEVLDRVIPISDKVNFYNKKVLITGGYGFVGTTLHNKLLELGVRNRDIFRLDHKITDVANYQDLEKVFARELPDVVFHLAAQRLPGLAEVLVRETSRTCILGAKNIVALCEKYDVSQCIFSSTGKASRYYTSDIYTGSKKVAEWIFGAQRYSRCKYGIVRFTHIVENSPVSAEFDRRIKEENELTLHAPDRFIFAQNVSEAVSLLLNATVYITNTYPKLFSTKDLGWAINTTDIALYKLQQSKKDIPIRFTEVPKGYETSCYLGHIDREFPSPMFNVLETEKAAVLGPMIQSKLADYDVLNYSSILKQDESEIRSNLQKTVHATADSQFKYANKILVNKILKYGKEANPHPIQYFILQAVQ